MIWGRSTMSSTPPKLHIVALPVEALLLLPWGWGRWVTVRPCRGRGGGWCLEHSSPSHLAHLHHQLLMLSPCLSATSSLLPYLRDNRRGRQGLLLKEEDRQNDSLDVSLPSLSVPASLHFVSCCHGAEGDAWSSGAECAWGSGNCERGGGDQERLDGGASPTSLLTSPAHLSSVGPG